ncbi:hypothetical protein IF1G_00038 [Cordyceps javanica]|uniref:Uncharacterized protein n=1 Tax=Cordyceps javanica TaxID=43265 RepID=A0A545VEF5_9HYPO|nr:hypothetical protein IF1G_00038 [Cordyceps javanica]
MTTPPPDCSGVGQKPWVTGRLMAKREEKRASSNCDDSEIFVHRCAGRVSLSSSMSRHHKSDCRDPFVGQVGISRCCLHYACVRAFLYGHVYMGLLGNNRRVSSPDPPLSIHGR